MTREPVFSCLSRRLSVQSFHISTRHTIIHIQTAFSLPPSSSSTSPYASPHPTLPSLPAPLSPLPLDDDAIRVVAILTLLFCPVPLPPFSPYLDSSIMQEPTI